MPADIKFCGITRAEDARLALELGARYVGVIFAGGPRRRSLKEAEIILDGLADTVQRVGVFSAQSPDEILSIASRLSLHVLQLHEPASVKSFGLLRAEFNGEIWLVHRVRGAELPRAVMDSARVADAVVLDAHVPGMLGGTGVALPWEALSEACARMRSSAKLVLAGGLRPENVQDAITVLRPDVVDVSSGVESSPGVKDAARMRAFRDAVTGAMAA